MYFFWIGFFVGLLIFPLLYAVIPYFFCKSQRSKNLPILINHSVPVSEQLKMEIERSLIFNYNLEWLNVIIQRMFFDSIRNCFLENKIKENLMKNFSSIIGEGLLKNVKIKNINFGLEAPYLKKIKLITPEEYKVIVNENSIDESVDLFDITSDEDNFNYSIENNLSDLNSNHNVDSNKRINYSEVNSLFDIKTKNSRIDDIKTKNSKIDDNKTKNSKIDDNKTKNSKKSANKTKNANKIDYFEINRSNNSTVEKDNLNSIIEFDKQNKLKHKEIFKNSTFLGSFEYNGTIQIMIEVELPKGITISLMITFQKIHSNFLFRTPAINHETRYEFTLIQNPIIKIEVNSGLMTELKKLYFQNSISGFVKKSVLNSFKSMFVFPCWYQVVQPHASSCRLRPFYPVQITSFNYQDAIEALEHILLIICSDFKPVNIKNGIIHRKSHVFLNSKDFVYFWSFKLPTSQVNLQMFEYFENLSSSESKILFYLQSPEGLLKIFPCLKNCTVAFKAKNVSILKMTFGQYEHEFIRVIYRNNAVFYKNNTNFSEFILFKIQDKNLMIFNFSANSSGIFFNDNKVEILKEMIDTGNLIKKSSIFKTTMQNKNIISVMKRHEIIENELKSANFETLFKEALRVDNGEFNKFTIKLKITKESLMSILEDPEMEIKMFEEYGKFVGCIDETQNIRTLTAEYKTLEGIKELRIHSFHNEKYKMNACPERNQIFIYKITNFNTQRYDNFNTQRYDNLDTQRYDNIDRSDYNLNRKDDNLNTHDDNLNTHESNLNTHESNLNTSKDNLITEKDDNSKTQESNFKQSGNKKNTKNKNELNLVKSRLKSLNKLHVSKKRQEIKITAIKNETLGKDITKIDIEKNTKMPNNSVVDINEIEASDTLDNILSKETDSISQYTEIKEKRPFTNKILYNETSNSNLHDKKTESDTSKKTENAISKKTENAISKKTENDTSKKTESDTSKKTENDTSKKTESDTSKKTENAIFKKTENAISKKTESVTILTILYKSAIPVFFPNFFIEALKIKECYQKYFELMDPMQYTESFKDLSIESYVKAGTIYFEFCCDFEDDYKMEIFSCKKQMVVFKASKIISSKIFKLILPVENDYIKIQLISKFKKNFTVNYKLKEFCFKKDIFIEGLIGLSPNEKFSLKIKGSPTHVIFWEKNSIKPTEMYLQEAREKIVIDDRGILRADDKEYAIIIKNKAEKQRNIKIYAGLSELI